MVLLIVGATKGPEGAWIVIAAMPFIVMMFQSIHRHYDVVLRELRRGRVRAGEVALEVDEGPPRADPGEGGVRVHRVVPPGEALGHARCAGLLPGHGEEGAPEAVASTRTPRSRPIAIRSTSKVEVTLAPGERAMVPTGIALALPDGYVALVHPRSGLAARHGLSIVNTPGTIDAGYRGEVKVMLINHDPREPIELEGKDLDGWG